ncbi:unnamed protein product [Ranitomeya imitator]|uniref:ribonuclease H n=1 Tax=Ranitomeya imitator TaxID=111125 RepID=A0ABN9LLI1_9NEOB|nr:unnamed protein product [Ranitomeya imitator]
MPATCCYSQSGGCEAAAALRLSRIWSTAAIVRMVTRVNIRTQSNLTERETGSESEAVIDPVSLEEEVAGPSLASSISILEGPSALTSLQPAASEEDAAPPPSAAHDQGSHEEHAHSSSPTGPPVSSPQAAGALRRGRRRRELQATRSDVDAGVLNYLARAATDDGEETIARSLARYLRPLPREGMSVNDGIPSDETAVTYISFDKAVDLIRNAGPGALMAKSDIESAFRLLPVHPDCHHLLGAKFEDLYYYDTCLPMGCSISCFYFELFSTFLEWVARKITRLTHYLDDFLIVGPAGSDVCAAALAQFKDAMAHFGVPLSPEKTIGPVPVITFLGIEIDSVAMEFRLPKEKIDKLLDLISGCISVGKVTLTQMQLLLGSLNFACRVMPAGRIFSRRLMIATRGVKQRHHRIRITAHLRSDLNTWKLFLSDYNGRTCFQETECSNVDMGLFFAASSNTGFRVRFGNKLCASNWPAFWVSRKWNVEATLIELVPVAVAMDIWGPQLANKRIRLNLQSVGGAHAINYLASPSPQVLDLIRFIVLRCLTFNVWLKANALTISNDSVSGVLTGFYSQDLLDGAFRSPWRRWIAHIRSGMSGMSWGPDAINTLIDSSINLESLW